MVAVNPHFFSLNRPYIFPLIEEKISLFKKTFPKKKLLNLGIGDSAQPLKKDILEALMAACLELGEESTFKGYGPAQGYLFLREKIAAAYAPFGFGPDEIFISEGINPDMAHFQELFSPEAKVGIQNPTYPLYLDASMLSGRAPFITELPCNAETDFFPQVPNAPLDVIYLCNPNNPTGTALTKDGLKRWVDFALDSGAIILYDGAYAAFVRSPDVPRSIYEIEGAEKVAVEFRSFSKFAAFTGLRCSYSVVPKSLKGEFEKREVSLHDLWKKRQSTKFNGLAYPVQKAAAAALEPEMKKTLVKDIDAYMAIAKFLKNGLDALRQQSVGGADAPYIWWKIPEAFSSSWEFFDFLLSEAGIVSLPGEGFGSEGKNYVRLSAFTQWEIAEQALENLKLCCEHALCH